MFNNQRTSVTTFSNAQFGDLRTHLSEDGNVWFCLSDVANALGLEQASRLKSRLKVEGVTIIKGVSLTTNQHGKTTKQIVDLNFINEPNLYRCIFQSRKTEAEQFQNWVFEEVLPSIRTNGGYIASTQDDSPELIMARALQVAQATIDRHKHQLEQANERIALQSTQLKQQAPKVKYVDEVLQSTNTYTSTQMSKELGMKDADRLHKALREKGVMFKQSGQWMLTAKYCGHDYTKTRTHQFTRSDGSTGTNAITVWTEKGRAFLHKILNIQIIKEIA